MTPYTNHAELAEFNCIPQSIEHLCLAFVYYKGGYESKEVDTGKILPTRYSTPQEEDNLYFKKKDEDLEINDEDTEEEEDDIDSDLYIPAGETEWQEQYFLNLEDTLGRSLDDIHDSIDSFFERLEPNLRAQTFIRSAVIHENRDTTPLFDAIENHSGVQVYGMERWTSLFEPVATKYLVPMYELLMWDNPSYLSHSARYTFGSYITENKTRKVYYEKGTGETCTMQLLKEFGYDIPQFPFDLPGVHLCFIAKLPKEYMEKWEKLLREYWAWSDAGCPEVENRTPIFTHDN